ncbi:hypothetical protein Q8A73_004118 [Channa argus]|nr:hypothetical protein Q8A73_004118 [Channa argus]
MRQECSRHRTLLFKSSGSRLRRQKQCDIKDSSATETNTAERKCPTSHLHAVTLAPKETTEAMRTETTEATRTETTEATRTEITEAMRTETTEATRTETTEAMRTGPSRETGTVGSDGKRNRVCLPGIRVEDLPKVHQLL